MVYRKALIASVFASSVSFAAQQGMNTDKQQFLKLMEFLYENADAIEQGKISVDSESDMVFGAGTNSNLTVNAEVWNAVQEVLKIIPVKEEGAEDVEASEPVVGKTAGQKSFAKAALSWKKKSSLASETPAVDTEAAKAEKARIAAEKKAKKEAAAAEAAEAKRILDEQKAKDAAEAKRLADIEAVKAAEAKRIADAKKAEEKRKAKEESDKRWAERKQKAEETVGAIAAGAASAAEATKGFFSRRLSGAQSVASQAKSSASEKMKHASASFKKSKKESAAGLGDAVEGAESEVVEVNLDNADSAPMEREAFSQVFEPIKEEVKSAIERKPTPAALELTEARRRPVQRRGAMKPEGRPELPPRPASYKQPAKQAEPMMGAPVEKSPLERAASHQLEMI